jgi:hypothetical protein
MYNIQFNLDSMQVAIRPMEANLTHDTEFLARMVTIE